MSINEKTINKMEAIRKRTQRKYKVEGGVKRNRWFRKLHTEHAKTLNWVFYYKNNEVD
jgi:AraC-like DNA-binding protein